MNSLPPAVRILPMNLSDEFPDGYTIEDAQRWFREELASREGGQYRCYTGIRAEPGTVVLFQCEAQIIASAVLTGRERFPEPDEDGYRSCLYFDVASITTFDPVGVNKIRQVWPDFKKFSQAKPELDAKKYGKFRGLLAGIRRPSTRRSGHIA